MLRRDLPVQPTDVERRLEEVVARRQVLTVGVEEVPCDPVQHLLGRGEVAGRLQDEDAVLGRPEDVQLAIGADVVHPGVRPRVGEEDESLVEAQREAVGQPNSSSRSLAPSGATSDA